MLDEVSIQCPYCWEPVVLEVEPGADSPQYQYVEDCQVCCRPMVVIVSAAADGCEVTVRGEDE